MKGNERPRRTEILEQLEKILESGYFISAETQGKVLRRMVESAVSGNTIKQQDLQTVTETNFDVDSHKGRQNALFVRRKLRDYYANEGKEDLVRIELPPGRSYKAVFRYNSNAVVIRVLRRARKFAELDGAPWLHAEPELQRAENANPASALLRVERASLDLRAALRENIFSCGNVWRHSAAGHRAEEAIALDADCWRAHVIQGAAKLMNFKWIESGRAFKKALAINREETERDLWYAVYRTTVGDTHEGLRISEERSLDDPEDASAHILHALFLYLARRYDEAHVFLKGLITNSYENEMAGVLHGLIWLAEGRADLALDVFERFGKISEVERDVMYEMRERGYVERQDIRTRHFSGLEVLSLMCLGRKKEAAEAMARLRREYPAKPLQSALAYMALGDNRRAFLWLHRAVRESDFLLNWLHLLPVFDLLRDDPIYVAIAKDRMALLKSCS
jgi:tetratricopeptide (TPR) repeat protein